MAAPAQRIQLGPFFDQGALCGAAQLEHYAAGTATLKNIWSDANETSALAQPFISDANGVFNFFADGSYKLVIKRADGTILHTLDNWKIMDVTQPSLAAGSPVATASSITIGDSTWAHWTGSVDVETISGSSVFYWAVADGSFSLIHSASLLCPDNRNRKVLSGDVLLFINEGSGIWRLSAHMQKEGGWTGRQCTTVAASSTIAVPTDGDFIAISGTTDIDAIATAQAGYRFRARFTGTGLNINYNATSMLTPWSRDYRTVPNEVMEFMSLGSGNWLCFSLNGPKERVGTVIELDSSTAPDGFLARDGSAVSRADYSGLYAEIGTTHGVGDGSTTFNLLDARGRVRIHVDGAANRITSASTNGANADTLGGTGGAQTHTLSTSEMPAHTHTQVGSGSQTVAAGAISVADSASANTGSTGGGGAHSNTQPWYANYTYIRF